MINNNINMRAGSEVSNLQSDLKNIIKLLLTNLELNVILIDSFDSEYNSIIISDSESEYMVFKIKLLDGVIYEGDDIRINKKILDIEALTDLDIERIEIHLTKEEIFNIDEMTIAIDPIKIDSNTVFLVENIINEEKASVNLSEYTNEDIYLDLFEAYKDQYKWDSPNPSQIAYLNKKIDNLIFEININDQLKESPILRAARNNKFLDRKLIPIIFDTKNLYVYNEELFKANSVNFVNLGINKP